MYGRKFNCTSTHKSSKVRPRMWWDRKVRLRKCPPRRNGRKYPVHSRSCWRLNPKWGLNYPVCGIKWVWNCGTCCCCCVSAAFPFFQFPQCSWENPVRKELLLLSFKPDFTPLTLDDFPLKHQPHTVGWVNTKPIQSQQSLSLSFEVFGFSWWAQLVSHENTQSGSKTRIWARHPIGFLNWQGQNLYTLFLVVQRQLDTLTMLIIRDGSSSSFYLALICRV